MTNKIAIISDIHFGVSNDSPIFLGESKAYFEDFLFPYLRENGIKTVVNAGDTFDKRTLLKYQTLEDIKKFYFEPMNNEFDLHVLIGNHDCPFKSTNFPNSVSLICKDTYPNIHIYESAQEAEIAGETMLMIPWINKENRDETLGVIKKSNASIAFGHLELSGFTMLKGIECREGMSTKLFSKFEMVLSGHFHFRSSKGNIHYLGNPHETTWADYGNAKGFHVFDMKTRELEFIENPRKIYYNFDFNSQNPIELPDDLNGKFVIANEIYSKKASDFDKFCAKIVERNPYKFDMRTRDKVVTIEDVTSEVTQEEGPKTTVVLMQEYIDENVSLPDENQVKKLKALMLRLHKDAGEIA